MKGKENKPAISVVMSIYKEPVEWLRQSVCSILNQTFPDFEFIIICDNPFYYDGIKLIKDYSNTDNRIKLIFNEENIGLTKSLNKGISIAKGKYIARMDADDISNHMRFKYQYIFMESHPEVIVVGTDYKYIGKEAYMKLHDNVCYCDKKIRAMLLFGNCIAHSSVFIRKSVLDENKIIYDENFRQSQDYRMWELLLPYGEFAIINKKLLKYRISYNQVSKKNGVSQNNNSNKVRYSLQKRWLESQGYKYDIDSVKNAPFEILRVLEKNKDVIKTESYRCFLQSVYMTNKLSKERILKILTRDWRYFTAVNMLRVLIRSIRN